MATPTVLDAEPLLDPIGGENPSGRNLYYEPPYDELREARRAEDDTLQGDWKRKAKLADWDRVVELGVGLLKKSTKDLQIAAWIAEALARRHGFAGLRDGFHLVREIQERFWDTYYPVVEDGDLDSRAGPFVFLNSTLPLIIRSIPLTRGFGERHCAFIHWQEARQTENLGLQDAEKMEQLIAEGKTTPQEFDDEVAQTPARFFFELFEDYTQARAAFKALEDSTDERFGRDAPSLVGVRKAFDDCRLVLEPIVESRREQESDGGEAEAEEEEGGGAGEAEESDSWSEPAARTPAPRKKKPARGGSSGGPIRDAADALDRIAEAAAYLRQNEPASPVPYLVLRAARFGEVYASHPSLDPTLLEAPPTEVRQELRRFANNCEWAELLEQSEAALGRPEGRGWLDVHRYAVAAMANGDVDRSAAAAGVRGMLRSFLADLPELLDAELTDGTPVANAETRAWLRDEVLPAAADPSANGEAEPSPPSWPAYEPPPAEPSGDESGEPDPWDEALGLAKRGRGPEAIQLIRRAMAAATTGRDRFLRKLQLAELCLMGNNHRVALPLSEDLARQVDEFRLEEWEDEGLSARVWGALYRCLRGAGPGASSAERAREAFTRLCRLDINQAMLYGDDGGG